MKRNEERGHGVLHGDNNWQWLILIDKNWSLTVTVIGILSGDNMKVNNLFLSTVVALLDTEYTMWFYASLSGRWKLV
jgi:hypothetical protein